MLMILVIFVLFMMLVILIHGFIMVFIDGFILGLTTNIRAVFLKKFHFQLEISTSTALWD